MSVQRVGIRGRVVLTIGIPMWLLLTPPQRIAVLGHELGHLVNRDPARRTLTTPALRIFQSAVEWSGGHSPWRRMGDRMFDEKQQSIFALVGMFVIALFNSLFATIQLAIEAIVMPDHRRAEYAADLLGREVDGTQAALEVEDRFVMMDHHVSGMKADAVSRPPTDWAQLATLRDRGYAADLPMLRQASRRETDLWSTHPPSGSRALLLAALPHVQGSVAVDLDQFALIDSELAGWYAALHREILGAEEFLG